MKRILLVALLSVCFVSLFAQLRQNVNGITLGVSTKNQVINKIKSWHKQYKVQDDVVIITEDNTFGGVSWFATYYIFHKNIVYKISYAKHANTSDNPKSLIDSQYSNLQRALKNKYGIYETRNYNSLYSTFTCFNDGKINVALEKGYYKGAYILNLNYTNLKILRQSFNDSDDEL